MKTLINMFLLFLALFPLSFAQESALVSAIEKLPTCAIRCLTTAVGESPCELTDQKCICTNAKLQSDVEVCVLRSCTVKEALTTKNVTATTCGAPVRSKVELLKTVNITMGVLSAAMVIMRITYKLVFCLGDLGWDDYAVLATLISGVPSTIISDRGTLLNGLGRDIWTLQFSQITAFVRYFYIMEVLYFLQITLLKLSLLFFYARIFPNGIVKRIIWGTIWFDILWGTAFVLAAIFQCRPISYYWNSWDGEHTGKCIDINALGWANAAISIALDIWMLAIPLSQLVHLKLAWKKKVGVALMFFVGTFVTVVSILRLQSLVHFANSSNPTWDQFEVTNWSTIEINVGIMCACMPALRVILVRLFPKVLGTTKLSSNKYYDRKYGSRSKGNEPIGGSWNSGGGETGLSSNASKDKSVRVRETGTITYTKTFEVMHGDNDEVGLVQMDDLSPKGSKVKSPASSELVIIGSYLDSLIFEKHTFDELTHLLSTKSWS